MPIGLILLALGGFFVLSKKPAPAAGTSSGAPKSGGFGGPIEPTAPPPPSGGRSSGANDMDALIVGIETAGQVIGVLAGAFGSSGSSGKK